MNYMGLTYNQLEYLPSENITDIIFLTKYENNFRKGIDTLGIGDLTEKKFGAIKDYQRKQFSFNDIERITNDFEVEFDTRILLYKAVQGYNYFVKSLKQLTDIENKLLAGRNKYNVSTKELEQLGYYWQIRELAGNDVTKIEAVENTKYSLCFLELLARKRMSDYVEKINEEIIRKSKNH